MLSANIRSWNNDCNFKDTVTAGLANLSAIRVNPGRLANARRLSMEGSAKMYKILDAADSDDYAVWLRLWEGWPQREVFAHPEYANLFARGCDRAVCAIQENPRGMILLPLILRPLAAEPWVEKDSPFLDAIAPYGFGGPFVSGQYDMDAFARHFKEWAQNAGVVSAFFRLSPFAADISNMVDTVDVSGGNVIRSLEEGYDEIWRDYKQLVRTHVKKATQSGVTAEFDEIGDSLPAFIRLYYRTMQRCHAAQQYYFSVDFFRKITTRLNGQYFLAKARYKEEVIASYLVLVSQDSIYYYLAGSNENFFYLRPNQFLTDAVFQWGIAHGKKWCVLGGGYEGYDGVFQYKKAFAPSGVVPFLVGKHIFYPSDYQEFCEKRKAHDLQNGLSWITNDSFFPAYRTKND